MHQTHNQSARSPASRKTGRGRGPRRSFDRPRSPASVSSAPHTAERDAPALEGAFGALLPSLQRAVRENGYSEPTPIQTQSLPPLLERRDLYGCAQTGTGKTAAFALPILQRLAQEETPRRRQHPHALILAPTRELAAQISESIKTYGRYTDARTAVIFGGVGQGPQVNALRRGVDIVVATPGRLLDLMQQRVLFLDDVGIFVLDEGDRMLDMGFLPDIRRIVSALPAQRQSMLFSATLPDAIVRLADEIVTDPVRIAITPEQPAVESIRQKVLFVDKGQKMSLLVDLLRDESKCRVIVFAQMKHVANRIAQKLEKAGIGAAAIHGNKSQAARTRALHGFKRGQVRVLVATDIAARGLDVTDVSHVINYDLPLEAETYVHRIGRTARAGADGSAVSFCSGSERSLLNDIERLLRTEVPVDHDHAYHCEKARRGHGPSMRPRSRPGRPAGSRPRRRRNR